MSKRFKEDLVLGIVVAVVLVLIHIVDLVHDKPLDLLDFRGEQVFIKDR